MFASCSASVPAPALTLALNSSSRILARIGLSACQRASTCSRPWSSTAISRSGLPARQPATQHIYAELGVSRQIELAQLVTSLADLPGTRR